MKCEISISIKMLRDSSRFHALRLWGSYVHILWTWSSEFAMEQAIGFGCSSRRVYFARMSGRDKFRGFDGSQGSFKRCHAMLFLPYA